MNNGAEIQRRLRELQDGTHGADVDYVERFGLYMLDRLGFETLNIAPYDGPNRWEVWAYETLVWTARRLRAKEYREALRGWGQLKEYIGRNGGFLCGASDHVTTIQNALERVLG